ncbi:tetratricopeptide repeat protein [bacterium]|nr:tetratricopeptide repeat protein [bacterium]
MRLGLGLFLILFISLFARAEDVRSKSGVSLSEIQSYLDAAERLVYTSPGEGIEKAKEALSLAQKVNAKSEVAASYNVLGLNYAAQNDFNKALEAHRKALELFVSEHDQAKQASVYANIGLIYYAKAAYPDALDNLHKAVQLNQLLGLKAQLASNLKAIAAVYARQKNYAYADQFYQDAQDIYEDLVNREGIAQIKRQRGIIQYELGEYKKAMNFFSESILQNKKLNNFNELVINYIYLGKSHLARDEYEDALHIYHKGMVYSRAYLRSSFQAELIGRIGQVYLSIVQDSMAENDVLSVHQHDILNRGKDSLEKALMMAKKVNDIELLVSLSKSLSEAYALSGFYRESLEAYRAYEGYRDSMYSEESNLLISNMISNHDITQKNNELLMKNQELLTKELEISERRNTLFLFAFLLAILIAAIFFIWNKFQASKAFNENLKSENELHLKKLEKQMDDLTSHSTVLREISYIQAHHVRGPVTTLLNMAQLFNHKDPSDPANKIVIENIEEVTKKLDESVKTVIVMGDAVREVHRVVPNKRTSRKSNPEKEKV